MALSCRRIQGIFAPPRTDGFNNAEGPQVRTRKKGPGNIIPALAILSLGGGLQAATQYFAHDFKYQPALGLHINLVYPPWGIIGRAFKWFNQYPDAFMHADSLGIIVTGVGRPTSWTFEQLA